MFMTTHIILPKSRREGHFSKTGNTLVIYNNGVEHKIDGFVYRIFWDDEGGFQDSNDIFKDNNGNWYRHPFFSTLKDSEFKEVIEEIDRIESI
jgi:hypothetical protein